MNAETIHDALTLLPADLIAETDRKRSRKPHRIHWQRWAAMAACLVLIAYGGLLFQMKLLSTTAEAPAEAEDAVMAAGTAENYDITNGTASQAQADNSQVTSGTRDSAQTPQAEAAIAHDTGSTLPDGIFGIRYVQTPDNLYSTECYISGPGITLVTSRAELDTYCDENQNQYFLEAFLSICESYDEIWFETHDLLLIALDAIAPADGNPIVTEITPVAEGLEVCVSLSPENDTGTYTNWHILLETEKGQVSSEEAVSLVFE